ncbi:HK97 gp10 family phage protein [Eubacteriales bacterium KG125]
MVDKGDVTIKIHTSEFKRGFDRAESDLKQLMYQRMITTTEFLKSKAIEEAPADTGNLRARMVKRTFNERGQVRGLVGNTAEYAAFVHQGTGIHSEGGAGRKTSWKVVTVYKGNKVGFITRGQRANPFLTRAKEKNMDKIKRLLGVK